MRKNWFIVSIFLYFSILSSAVVCDEFYDWEHILACGYTENISVNGVPVYGVLYCDDSLKTIACKSSSSCGFKWDYSTYGSLELLECSTVHGNSILPCDMSTLDRYSLTDDPTKIFLKIDIPSCSKEDVHQIKLRRYQYNPFWPGFEKVVVFGGKDPIGATSFSIGVPKDMELYYYSSFGSEPKVHIQDNITYYLWVKYNVSGVQEEYFMPPEHEIFDVVVVSSHKDYSEILEFESGIYPKDKDSGVINKLADDIVGNASGGEAIRLLYDWVRLSIEYEQKIPLTVELGLSPRAPEEVLESKKGDCKDVSYLLSELLRAKGFDAEPALFGAYNEIPYHNAFEHVIVKLDYNNKTLWMDATCPVCPLGILTPNMYGRYVLPIYSGELEMVPEYEGPYFDTRIYLKHDLSNIDPVKITYDYEYVDLMSAEEERVEFKSMTPSQQEGYFENIIGSACPVHTTLETQMVNLNDSSKPLTRHIVYLCPGITRINGDEISFQVGNENPLPEHLKPENRVYDIVLEGSERILTETEIVFPEGYTITSEPKEYNFSEKEYTISKSVEKEGNKIKITRLSYLNKRIPKEMYPGLRKAQIQYLDTREDIIATSSALNWGLILTISVLILLAFFVLYH